MSIAEFFSYLMGHGPSRELAKELATVSVTRPALPDSPARRTGA